MNSIYWIVNIYFQNTTNVSTPLPPPPPPSQPLPSQPQITQINQPNDLGISFPSSIPVHHPTDVVSINSIPLAPPVYSLPTSPLYGNYDPSLSGQYPNYPPQQPQQQQQQFQQYQPPMQQLPGPGYSQQSPSQPIQQHQIPSTSGVAYKKPPTFTIDERTKDALELCAFAMTAMKVMIFILIF